MRFRKPKIKMKTDEECEKEIDDIISGKNKAMNARIVRAWIKTRRTVEPMESIRLNLIAEYKDKYQALATGKTSLKEMAEEVNLDTGIEPSKGLKRKKA